MKGTSPSQASRDPWGAVYGNTVPRWIGESFHQLTCLLEGDRKSNRTSIIIESFLVLKTCPLGSAWVLTQGQLTEIFRYDAFWAVTGAACLAALDKPLLLPLTN
jgi:hypothetical protein